MIALMKISLWMLYWVFFCVPFTLCFMVALTLQFLIKKLYNETKSRFQALHH